MLENAGSTPLTIFQVDLFSARGDLPRNLAEVDQRQKDIRFSSRTRLTTDRFRELHTIAAAANRLKAKLPPALQNDHDLAALCAAGPQGQVTLMHLIHRKETFEGVSKDYEFSRLTMKDHWAAGLLDVAASLTDPAWAARNTAPEHIAIFDFGAEQRDPQQAAS